jgi:UDP-galactopyranose mutase
MKDDKEIKNILIIGSGISGCVLAERYANIKNYKVTLIEKRGHLGGNCYDYINDIGIRINKYGPHYFRTNDEEVWKYIRNFSTWVPFEAKCLSIVDGKKVPIPVNIDTINLLFDLKLSTEKEIKDWLSKETENILEPKNSEESALKRVGKKLYEKMFKNYTIKQWDKNPKELDASIMDRIPIRFNHDDRYFTDKYQMYPTSGYTKVFENMLNHPNISIKLNTNWNDVKNIINNYEKIFFTGKIDEYFEEKFGKLEYRSLRFEEQNIDKEFFQDTVQENYPDINVSFTRIVEYKYQTKQKNLKTTIVKEFPTWEGDPYYPVSTESNKILYKKYQDETELLKNDNIYFVGRLANYKYLNMDQTIKNALEIFTKLENK